MNINIVGQAPGTGGNVIAVVRLENNMLTSNRVVPAQKPGLSKQNYGTPKELINAVKSRLRIDDFAIDLAADETNTVTSVYYGEKANSLLQDWSKIKGWAWLNPPFGKIAPWVEKAASESHFGAHICMLVPSSVGSNWWSNWVEPFAYVSHLNGRITFVGETLPYIKDCSILLYQPWGMTGHDIWTWK